MLSIHTIAALMFLTATIQDQPSVSGLKRMEETRRCMGTTLRVVLYAPTEILGRKALDLAFARAEELNNILSDYQNSSELMRLCARAGGPPVAVSRELFTVLSSAQHLSRMTDGAFDVTIGPVSRLWRLARKSKRMPDPADLASARALVGYQMMELEPATKMVKLTKPGMRLDLGGIAKGFTNDELLELLKREEMPRSLVALGGDIACGDAPPGKNNWEVAIIPLPGDPEPGGTLFLKNQAVSTSGDLEQYLEIDGVRYSHIVDARTGIGTTRRASATVVAPKGIDADRLTKAGILLPFPKALSIIVRQEGAHIRVVTPADSGPGKVQMDAGFPKAKPAK
ncbi:MAG: FAD:protein FMN transferase [Planctomycetota bacterium]|nr:FAD:protein FMN transferase [Planctomycetota bacterium]